MEVDGEGFQVVSGRKCRHRCHSKQKTRKHFVTDQDRYDNVENFPSDPLQLTNSINKCRLELAESEFRRDFEVAAIKVGILAARGDDSDAENCRSRIDTIVSYGIGNFSTCPIARYQFSFLRILCEMLKVKENNCFLFDPVFSNREKEGILKWGYQLINTNEEGKRLSEGRTLYYMPHCSKALYNNVVWANWDPVHLANTIIIGNSFMGISESIPERKFNTDLQYISKAMKVMQEISIPNTFLHKDIFNNMSLHRLYMDDATPEPKEIYGSNFWLKTQEPEYDDAEMIRPSL